MGVPPASRTTTRTVSPALQRQLSQVFGANTYQLRNLTQNFIRSAQAAAAKNESAGRQVTRFDQFLDQMLPALVEYQKMEDQFIGRMQTQLRYERGWLLGLDLAQVDITQKAEIMILRKASYAQEKSRRRSIYGLFDQARVSQQKIIHQQFRLKFHEVINYEVQKLKDRNATDAEMNAMRDRMISRLNDFFERHYKHPVLNRIVQPYLQDMVEFYLTAKADPNQPVDYHLLSSKNLKAYLKSVSTDCRYASLIAQHCAGGLAAVKMNTPAEWDHYFMFLMFSENRNERINGLEYFAENCDPLLKAAPEVITERLTNGQADSLEQQKLLNLQTKINHCTQ